jgi:hypothetical protein
MCAKNLGPMDIREKCEVRGASADLDLNTDGWVSEGGDKKAERIVNAFWQRRGPEIMTRADCSFISGVSCFADAAARRATLCYIQNAITP